MSVGARLVPVDEPNPRIWRGAHDSAAVLHHRLLSRDPPVARVGDDHALPLRLDDLRSPGDDLPADQGVEVVSEISGPVTGKRWGTRTDGVYELVDDQTLVRHLSNGGSAVPHYVTYWTLTTDRTLMITNLGVWSSRLETDYYNRPLEPKRLNSRLGELKGCSVFRYVRMEETGRTQQLDRLRAEYNVRLSFDRRTTRR